jgi:glycosyltransferase involved in cell wall biosynthesis
VTERSVGRSVAFTQTGRKCRRKRVLHVIQNLNYGGMERVLADIVRGIDRERFEAHILAIEYLGRFAVGLDDAAELHVGVKMPRYSLLWPRALARQIAGIAPDVVHTHSGVWYKATLAARMAGVPRIVHTEHGRRKPDPFSDRAIDWLAARRTDVVAAVSARLRDDLNASNIGGPSKVVVVPNGIDTAVFAPAIDDGRVRRELHIDPDTPIIGSIGRLEPIKGYDLMINAFSHLRETWRSGPLPVLLVGGEGSERARLARMVEERGLSANVRLLGWRDDIHALHATFTLFTMSSHSEGTSISLLEAMSDGVCPVVTDVGGNRAVVGDDLAHRLVPPENPVALAEAWCDALLDPQRRRADCADARLRVQRCFDLRTMVKQYESLYDGGA